MEKFIPNYQNMVDAAYNRTPNRVPLYEHGISNTIIGKIIGVNNLSGMFWGTSADLKEYFKHYTGFLKSWGYDVVILDLCIVGILPGGGALGGHKEGVIKDRADFEKYPWDEIPELFFKYYTRHLDALTESMPDGMKALGGPAYGLFEIVQDLTGYMNLCYISVDDRELYEDLFKKVGDIMVQIWNKFLQKYADQYCVLRFGDDLGFKSQTLIPHEDIRQLMIPQYRRITDLVHSYNKPFLLHSCGCIFDVMDDLINDAKIDAKHSNEDVIAPFSKWVELYGDRIGNFGGIDTDIICGTDTAAIKEYVTEVYKKTIHGKGIAYGSGNSVPDYVSLEGYEAMNITLRELRGDFSR